MYFIHGTKTTPAEPEFFGFKTFNYKIGRDGLPENEMVGSGNDEHGPGVYAFGSENINDFTRDDVFGAKRYGREGAVVGFSLDLDLEYGDEGESLAVEPINHYPATLISEGEWLTIANDLIDRIRGYHSYYYDDLAELCNTIADSEELSLEERQEMIESSDLWKFGAPQIIDYENASSWLEDALYEIKSNDPALYIEESGVDYVASKAVRADDAWDSIKFMFYTLAYDSGSSMSYNELFIHSVLNNTENSDYLKFARVNNDLFYVIFDVSSANVFGMEYKKKLLDEPNFECMKNEFIELGESSRDVLEPQQLLREYNKISNTFFGIDLPEPIIDQLLIVKDENSITEDFELIMKDSYSTEEKVVWDKGVGRMREMSQMFEEKLKTELPTPVVEFGNNTGSKRRF